MLPASEEPAIRRLYEELLLMVSLLKIYFTTPNAFMKFEDFTYVRPEMDDFTSRFEVLLDQFENASSFSAQNEAFSEINKMRTHFFSMHNICYIRHTIDTKDEFYEKENNFFDEQMPNFEALNTRFYRSLLESTFRKELEKKWGNQLFVIAELSLKTFRPAILEDLQEENRLSSEYIKLKAGAAIEFRGKEYNLSSIQIPETDTDRETRKEASKAKWAFFSKRSERFDQLFDQLVSVRHRIARKLGFKNFVELAYARMVRSDYNAEMVAEFRRQVQQDIVPMATKLYQRQTKRLGLDALKFYDEDFRFPTGNPKPKGEPDWIVNEAKEMYEELSSETGEFFRFMQGKGLMDLINRPGKATGGYCTYIGAYKAPYIFSNFNGTSGDIDVLTHEAGHAFQMYSSRDIGINEYNWPTYEACEIHSMSMEFFTWPWMARFFKEDTEKYRFAHLANAICFLPYGVAVDEFQHEVYEKPDMSPEERHACWKKIEQKYLPHRDYDGLPFLEKGGFWQKQSHIFASPFYYIDYTLAQICAFQFWVRNRQDHESAWQDYLKLCKAGGSRSFLELVKLAGLESPFRPGCLQQVMQPIRAWLEHVDDSKF